MPTPKKTIHNVYRLFIDIYTFSKEIITTAVSMTAAALVATAFTQAGLYLGTAICPGVGSLIRFGIGFVAGYVVNDYFNDTINLIYYKIL